MAQDRRRVVQEWLLRHSRGMTPLPTTSWDPGSAPPRVLVECDDDAVSWAVETALGRAGYEVATCSGPSETARCSLIDSGRCELQAGADVIVNCLDGGNDDARSVARRTTAAYPRCPLIVDVEPSRPSDDASIGDPSTPATVRRVRTRRSVSVDR